MNPNVKMRNIRYANLLSNKELSELTKGCRLGQVSEQTVRKWFSISDPLVPRPAYVEAIIEGLKYYSSTAYRKREHLSMLKLQFTMKEFVLSKHNVSNLLKVRLYRIDRWLKSDDPDLPTDDQLIDLRKKALCLAKQKKG